MFSLEAVPTTSISHRIQHGNTYHKRSYHLTSICNQNGVCTELINKVCGHCCDSFSSLVKYREAKIRLIRLQTKNVFIFLWISVSSHSLCREISGKTIWFNLVSLRTAWFQKNRTKNLQFMLLLDLLMHSISNGRISWKLSVQQLKQRHVSTINLFGQIITIIKTIEKMSTCISN